MDFAFWFAAALATFFVGMSKGGLPMVAMLGVPILSIFIAPAAAAGLLLPMYILADCYGIYLFRGSFSARNLCILIPATAIGILLAFLFISRIPVPATKLLVGAIGLGYLIDALRKRLRQDFRAKPADVPRGLIWGALAGFTSYVSHAGGPPFQAYTLPQKLPKMTFAGTATILFACVNWMKLPPYILAGQVTLNSLSQIAVLAPLALLGAWSGFRVTKWLPEKVFFTLVNAALLAVSVKLLWEGATGWS
ncbi:sulfite exporter TauE/SafE family protein [Salipiger mucosus]|uniref:Probable membrane transporter protein n=1 Tax=Salipiger mucosus DSM 16094 TaxID=1123237 RepID=S9RPD3_9RHOB|nr:sulfite exporter TauE/SafE family protein [Salipiger mucosus]EPX75889.1 Integral membrane protein [Salipiger mucosus DSM 16094]